MVATKSEVKEEVTPKTVSEIISQISQEAGSLAPTVDPNSGLKFAFRGINAVVDHIAPLMQKYKLVVLPSILQHTVTAREISGGRAITQTEVVMQFAFVAPDGSREVVSTAGLAQDYADRSSAQAQSVAFRVALLQTFTLPTADKDPEAAGEDTQKYIAEAAKDAPKPVSTQAGPTAKELTGKIKGWITAGGLPSGEPVTAAEVNAVGDRITEGDKAWKTKPESIQKVIAALEAGERK